MIYTLTMNPSLDMLAYVDDFEPGKINRTHREKVLPGGKGINVSLVLKNLNRESVALGFLAGFVGEDIEKLLMRQGVRSEFIMAKNGLSRINVKVLAKEETQINGQGPLVDKDDLDCLFRKLKQLNENDYLVMSGSVCRDMQKDIYARICEEAGKLKVKCIVDATGALLTNALVYKPFLIKPNLEELGEIFGSEIVTNEDAFYYAKKLKKMGAENVIVSLGKKGAIMVDSFDNKYFVEAPQGKVINTVGAGDSLVAGFLSEYIESKDMEKALKTGVYTGSASAFSSDLATLEEVRALLFG